MLSYQLQYISRRRSIGLAKQIHRVPHAHPQQTKLVWHQAGILAPELERAIDGIDALCKICMWSIWPGPSQRISLSHINEAFNMEIQINFAFVYFGTLRHTFFMMDAGTRFTEEF